MRIAITAYMELPDGTPACDIIEKADAALEGAFGAEAVDTGFREVEWELSPTGKVRMTKRTDSDFISRKRMACPIWSGRKERQEKEEREHVQRQMAELQQRLARISA